MTDTIHILRDLVAKVKCKPGWDFALKTDDETGGLCLVITVLGPDSATPDIIERQRRIGHWHPVPLTTFNEASWKRWMFEKCRGVENHELGEWFRFGAERPFSPCHGPGEDPYVVNSYRPMIDQLTTQDGSIREPYE